MSVQHKSLRDEILFVIGRSSLPLNSGEIYERCELAEEMKQVSNALFQLHAADKLQRIEGEGRVRYALASGVAAPAPAGKAGRPQELPVAPAPIEGIRPVLDIPTLADPGISLQGKAGKTRRTASLAATDPAILRAGAAAAAERVQKRIVANDFAEADAVVLRGIDVAASAERMADGMLAKTRARLRQGPRWWVDQNGNVEIIDSGDVLVLSREQAARMARMVLAMHAAMVSA